MGLFLRGYTVSVDSRRKERSEVSGNLIALPNQAWDPSDGWEMILQQAGCSAGHVSTMCKGAFRWPVGKLLSSFLRAMPGNGAQVALIIQ
eukprot:scaffold57777_cov16-Prasinocladus_malaysianus.AAC.1